MNEFEKKAFRYQFLGELLDDATRRVQYYMDYETDEGGDYKRDENGKYILCVPKDDYNRSRYEAALKIVEEFKAWALK